MTVACQPFLQVWQPLHRSSAAPGTAPVLLEAAVCCVCETDAVQGRELPLLCGQGQALCWDTMLQIWPWPLCLSTRWWTSGLVGCLLPLPWMPAVQVGPPSSTHSLTLSPISDPAGAAGRCTCELHIASSAACI